MVGKKVEAVEPKVEPKERRIKVMCKRGIWLSDSAGKPCKVAAGDVVLLSADEIKHFGSAVTKDTPDEANEYERI